MPTSNISITTATALLLLRDRRHGNAPGASLTSTVQRARIQRPPHQHYRLELTSNGTHIKLTSVTTTNSVPVDNVGTANGSTGQYANKLITQQPDEGFESDIDSLSIVSSDSINVLTSTSSVAAAGGGVTETDSANGSACSDDSDDNSASDKTITSCNNSTSSTCTILQRETTDSYNLVNILCYTDVTYPDLLVVLIDAGDTLVFRFSTATQLTSFYASFTALKAVSQQRTYSTLGTAKFNLLHRTDTNGITHIEIARDRIAKWSTYDNKSFEPSSIISLDTPEHVQDRAKYLNRTYENRQRVANELTKSLSTENILDSDFESKHYHSLSYGNLLADKSLRKVWSSAENLLDTVPVKPERRKRIKQRAPQPPVLPPTQLVVNLIPSSKPSIINEPTVVKSNSASRNMRVQLQNFFSSTKGGSTSKALSYQPFKYSDPKHLVVEPPQRTVQYINPWSSTVPRLLRHNKDIPAKPKVESMTFISHLSAAVPIRYVHHHPKAAAVPKPISNSYTISNRLFGMSAKLKDFSSVQCGTTSRKGTNNGTSSRWNSLGELTGTYSGNLKSVIKKEDAKKNKEKKVTFSDFTTVKVL